MKKKIAKSPSDTLALFNCVIVGPGDLDADRYVKVFPDHNPQGFAFQVKYVDEHLVLSLPFST